MDRRPSRLLSIALNRVSVRDKPMPHTPKQSDFDVCGKRSADKERYRGSQKEGWTLEEFYDLQKLTKDTNGDGQLDNLGVSTPGKPWRQMEVSSRRHAQADSSK